MKKPLLVLVFFSCLCLGWVSAQTPKAADMSGLIVYLDGEVTVNGNPADTGDRLSGQSIIRTGKKSIVEIVFGDQNIFRLGADTVLKVDFSTLKKEVTLENGLFTSVLKKLAKVSGDAGFVLKTPTVNAGVRGTSFHVTTDGNHTYFCTCNGSVALTPDQGATAQEIVLTNAHHGARVFTRQADGSVTVENAGLQDHSDASIETLAAKIGVKTDWSKPDLSTHTP